ncbi:RecQ family ATP-dependent DNA helicase [Treponema ruminis]|uniref:ATP-dependent DNA helicase RecQ n=1 Tax=Treponema ruminis TaxID=744515 RepID=A0A7W8LKS3_9SPIR|nr:RecQ family ATP-dependent DNA helicase [Treponema ruminis]MBB5224674.1 ATP-dependent DNA helicase RecQ [Treponema ruminis]
MDFTGAKPEAVLKSVFGYDSFRLLQKDIITNVLKGKDTLAIMPTGGGKSLCYQIPALIFEGLTVVVSPLISLMQDQVAALNANGINAVFLNSTVEWEDYKDSMNSIRRGETKIVYVSPEGLMTPKINDLLHDPRVTVSCITIDEAHCVSEWGHDFRPDYLEISSLRAQFKNAVFLALTATATPHVREDIIQNLKLKNPALLVSSFDRPNIYLDVRQKGRNALEQVIECIKRHNDESGIIYCFSKRQVDELTDQLSDLGYSVSNYHAGLLDSVRADHQTKFIRDQVQIMVATLAFGMGIDKPNVRFVIHYDMPKSLEQYYQEIGRAGRDGLPSEALLLYSAGDIHKIRYFFEEAADKARCESLLQGMISYATGRTCRRKLLLSYFGETFKGKNEAEKSGHCCDLCDLGPIPEMDMTIPCQKLMSCIIRTGSRFGAAYVIEVLLGSRNKRIIENEHNMISTWGIGKELDKDQWHEVVNLLIEKNYVTKYGDYNILLLTNEGLAALKNRDKIMLPFNLSRGSGSKGFTGSLEAEGTFIPKSRASSGANGGLMFPKPEKKKSSHSLTWSQSSSTPKTGFVLHKKEVDFSDDEEGKRIQAELKKWRKRKAEEMNVPPYVIFGDKTMNDIAQKKPRTEAALFDVNGLGEKKVEKFGKEILSIVGEE